MKNVNTLNKIALSILALAGFMALSANTQAEVKCYGQYGNEIECPVINKSFNIDKTVISGANFVEEVRGVRKDNQVQFNLVVENTGELKVSGLQVIDNLPANLEFLSLTENGTAVNVRVEQNSVSWTLNDFAPKAKHTYVMTTKANIKDIAQNTEKCVVNVANIMYNGVKESSNTATACIINPKGEVLGNQVLPETDASNIALLGFSLTLTVAGGFGFIASRKFS